ncbi:MAG: sensor domain-containing diguanylate cyclase [Deltaproteobacteria bacterium]|nr:sensor domain-containing diguanylate cyclase [Deltaproteobacteria bacterium]TLN03705.1 MAG: GGDEF domain-containing protein [bacterium]
MNELSQLFDTVNIGLVVLDCELRVRYWNRWMEHYSGVPVERIAGAPLFDYFPSLNSPKFLRSCQSVLAFGNFSFFSQKLHHYFFPFRADSSFTTHFEFMQQSCSMGPLRDEDKNITSLYLTVQDVTELALYEHRLLEMNMRDGLTGVYNRLFLEQRLAEEFERHVRYSRNFSIIMFDIDFFKKVNDTYGHQCGDIVLKGVSGKISSIIRKTDFLARYGGEQFCCLLPETGLASAKLLAERFRTSIAGMTQVCQAQDISVTISLGVSELSRQHASPSSLFERADEALYQAKHSGRNQVVALA